ncbi:ABC transporter transmembrane region [Leptospira ryugenii]|uniref:ABC transporter transmembrane region n=1 Tax=Leptospira ryugenii TaxID=1917863 RepID=A0A2P2E2N9_9LEPT|nr:ABC transporter ATP-binding protein [Leptospira ryugenii]GBF51148.1 ABC transporter transmembrane region [Leptospira ryugenii]
MKQVKFLKVYLKKLRLLFGFEESRVESPRELGDNFWLNLLNYFASINGRKLKPSIMYEILNRYQYRYPNITEDNFEDFLIELSVHFQVKLNYTHKSLEQIKNFITPNSPFVFIRKSRDGLNFIAYSITGYQSFKYKVETISIDHTEEWIPEKDLCQILGIKNTRIGLRWFISEPLYQFTGSVEKTKSTDRLKHVLNIVYQLISLERRDIWIVVIYGIGIGILSLVIPIATSSLVNIVSFGVLLQPVIVLTILVMFFLGFAGAMQIIQTYVVEVLERRVFVRIASEFAVKFPLIQAEVTENLHKPELANRFFDTMTIQKSVNTLLVEGLSVLLTTIIGFVLIGIYHPIFLLFDLFVLVVGFYYLIYRLGKKTVSAYTYVSKEKYRVAAWIEEIARHSAIFQSKFGLQYGAKKADTLIKDYLYSREKYFRNLILQIAGLVGLQVIASAIVLGLGGYLVINRELTIGQLVAAELVIAKVLSDIAKFGKQLSSFYYMIAAVDKIDAVLSLPLSSGGPHPFIPKEGPLEIEMSNIKYSSLKAFIDINGFNHCFKPRSITGITCEDPKISSIFLDLVAGIRVPEKGSIFFDQQDLHESDYKMNFMDTVLLRGNEIFEGSIHENLCLGRNDISLFEIRETLEKMNFWLFIETLPDGLHTKLNTFGNPFDTIQKSVLQIARAILSKPRLLVVDRILDGIPLQYLEPIFEILLDPKRPWTLLIASRSEAVLSRMETLMCIEDNTITPKPVRKRK